MVAKSTEGVNWRCRDNKQMQDQKFIKKQRL
ncbi:hypothetical protein QG37_07984 [Candidozyma auris]|uniref:Uncharacterized protein n=1 Tax=Candidozyma auris TaxID=498019 RepID=A0A0L0NNE6_CANAR|nr:hypothetical protein QG37_07984 [[Candida] auris]